MKTRLTLHVESVLSRSIIMIDKNLFATHNYQSLKTREEESIRLLKSKKRWVFAGRLLLFIGIIAVFYFLGRSWASGFSAVVLSALFLRLVAIDSKLKNTLDYRRQKLHFFNLQQENVAETIRINATTETNEYRDHDFCTDLGIIGGNSVFDYLNRCGLKAGEEELKEILTHIETQPEEIEKRQTQVNFLRDRSQFQARYYATGKQVGVEQDVIANFKAFVSKKYETVRWPLILFVLFSVLSTTVIVLAFLGAVPGVFVLYQFILGWVVAGGLTKKTSPVVNEIESFADALSPLYKLLKTASEEKLPQGHVNTDCLSQLSSFKGLLSLGNLAAQRSNLFVNAVLKGFFIWDLFLYHKAISAGQKDADTVVLQLEALVKLDAINSLAAFAGKFENVPFPEFSENDFEVKHLIHPFVLDDNPVPNSFSLKGKEKLSIVTGANMAGKSTFLRALGVNMVLASAGTVILGESMTFKPRRLFTSMRSGDDLFNSKSLFFAELERLQKIMQKAEAGEEYFILLDEILKGTNSVDKAEGSRGFIKKLLKYEVYGLIATHDLSLCSLAKEYPQLLKNNSFEVEIDGVDLKFDYTLRDGICKNMNASVLLRRMGLTDEQ